MQGLVAGGTMVTISGNYLDDAQQVYFGGNPAMSFQINSDLTIKAVSPMGASGAGRCDRACLRHDVGYFADRHIRLRTAAGRNGSERYIRTGGRRGDGDHFGTSLAGASAVDFGGVAATIAYDASTQIEVYTPAGTRGATVDVTVTTSQGTSATSAADQYTYNAGPPVVTGISPPEERWVAARR